MTITDISSIVDLTKPTTQARFASLVGVTQPAISDLVNRGILPAGGAMGEWLLAYCERMREQAAGRQAKAGDLDLAAERARLAKAQADKQEMDNAERRRELVPADVVATSLAEWASRIVPILEALPVRLRRASKALTADDLDLITAEIAKARNEIAAQEPVLDVANG